MVESTRPAIDRRRNDGGIVKPQINTLQELFAHQLSDLYSAEMQILETLPKMAGRADSDKLREGFEMHIEQTREHVGRLENVFQLIGETRDDVTCHGMQGLVKEGQESMMNSAPGPTCDAAMIAAAQRIEHYEIAGYGCVRSYADELGFDDASRLLQQTLDEEGKTNEKLTSIAEGGLLSRGVNVTAERVS